MQRVKTYLKKNNTFLKIYELLFQKPIINYFKKDYAKNALISYSTYHFNKKNYTAHSNYQESLIIAEIFDELGFNVDIINNNKFYNNINYNKYDVIFGEGFPLFQALLYNAKALIIYYGTGSHPWQCTEASLKRIIEFYRKTKFLPLESTRIQDFRWGLAASLADAVIVIGNETTKKTFENNKAENVYTVRPSFVYPKKRFKIRKNDTALKSMLYFASYGLLHKGLDLAVDAFRYFPDWTLHVCGYTDREERFIKSLNIPENVIIHGFVNIESNLFRYLCENCGYVILPSCSEGISTAVITAMAIGGMIPVVTKECGLDINDFGILIDDLSVDSVKNAIMKCNTINYEDLIYRTEKSISVAYSEYTIENYRTSMKKHLVNIIYNNKCCK